jgi:hypothetical protein
VSGPKGKPTGKVTPRRRSDPLPAFNRTLFGPFACLSEPILKVIHANEQWYGDGDPSWKNAPSAQDACGKAIAATVRLDHRNYVGLTGAAALALFLASCSPESRCGSHACPRCGRADQRWFVDAVRKLLCKPQAGFQDFAFNFVMPEGQAAIKDLGKVDFDTILRKCRIALSQCGAVEFAVLGIDTSANDDTDKFDKNKLVSGLRIYWQVHVYGIVRTSSRQAVWDALRHLFNKADNIYRSLYISKKPFDGSNKGISYISKPDGFRHVPYFDEQRGEWNTPHKPSALRAREQVHYLIAMHDLGFARRIALVGLHPVETQATKNKGRGVRLHRVYRGGSAM